MVSHMLRQLTFSLLCVLACSAELEDTCVADSTDSSCLLQARQGHVKQSLTPKINRKPTKVVYSIGSGGALNDKLEACLTTWAADLSQDQLQIIGSKPKDERQAKLAQWDEASDCGDSHDAGACKDSVGLANAYEKGADWVMLVGTDNYVMPENVESVLSSYNSSQPMVLGIKGCGDCPAGGLCGGGGQVISRGALQKFMARGRAAFLQEEAQEAKACGMWGDVSNCRVAAMHDVPVNSLLGLRGWADEISDIRGHMQATEPVPLTWHYVDPDKMQQIHKLKLKHPLEALQTGRHITNNAQQEVKYFQALEKHVIEEDARRRSPVKNAY